MTAVTPQRDSYHYHTTTMERAIDVPPLTTLKESTFPILETGLARILARTSAYSRKGSPLNLHSFTP